ncbi:MAG: ABC transporter permease [Acidobacteria bacterium]|nr:ABC transporter permease [Acidobacteriota bacterium]
MSFLGKAGGAPDWKSILASQEFGLILANLTAWLAILLLDPQHNFASLDSARLLLREGVLLGIYAIGAAIVIVAGGIDLSVGSVIAFSGVICAMLLQRLGGESLAAHQALPLWVIAAAILLTLAAGLLIGLFHTLLIQKLDLPPFITTLGTLAGLRSLAKVLSNDEKIAANNDAFRALYTIWWVPALIFLLIAIGAAVLMRRTAAGRHLYALGGNEEAARLSGLSIGRLKAKAYALAALLSAVAGILYAARQGQGDAESAVGYELGAIAAAVVGGCNLRGGEGTITGTILGVTFLTIVVNGIANVIKVDSTQWEGLVMGIVLILAVAVNRLRGDT